MEPVGDCFLFFFVDNTEDPRYPARVQRPRLKANSESLIIIDAPQEVVMTAYFIMAVFTREIVQHKQTIFKMRLMNSIS